MKKIVFVIKDLTTQSYYATYRGDESWTRNIEDANEYNSEEEILQEIDKQIEDEWGGYTKLAIADYLQIEKVIKITQK